MKLTLTSSDTVDISNARVSPIPTSGDEKRTNKAERSIDVLEFNGAPELNEDVKWKHSFTKLPVRENGNEISYTAEENEIPGYTTTIEKTDTGYVFTNTHIPETVTVTVDKVWDDSENQDGLRPDTIHIKLVSNGIVKDAYLDPQKKSRTIAGNISLKTFLFSTEAIRYRTPLHRMR